MSVCVCSVARDVGIAGVLLGLPVLCVACGWVVGIGWGGGVVVCIVCARFSSSLQQEKPQTGIRSK